MTYTEVKAGLNKALQTKFPIISDDPEQQLYSYYGLEVAEGYETPCFFTRLEAGNSRAVNKSTVYNKLIFSILYYPTDIDEIDLMDKVDTIRELFNLGCLIETETEKRYIDCTDFDWDFSGTERDYLEISIEFEYLVDIRRPEPYVTMNDIQTKWRV